MIVVFWLDAGGEALEPCARGFPPDALGEALQFAESLRARRRAGERLTHVTLQSELPGSVGPAGVADPDPAYGHYKRRINPAIPLGRPSGPPASSDPEHPAGPASDG